MRIIGIDPGTKNCGYSIVDVGPRRSKLVACGLINPKGEHNSNLLEIHNTVKIAVQKYKPEHAALESIFFNKNISSAVKIGEVRGCLIVLFEEFGISSQSYTPQQIKKATTGSGKAEKHQLLEVLIDKFKMDPQKLQSDHVVDATCIALCHYGVLTQKSL